MNEKGFLIKTSVRIKVIVFKHDSAARIQDDSQELIFVLKCVSADECLLLTFLIFKDKIQQKK